jgi:MFS family permease
VLKLLGPYRSVLAIAGTRSLFVVALLARVPATAKSMALTLHVVLDQHRGYGAAGLVGMAMTVGMGIGAPFLGRMIDRRGLRPVLLLTGGVELAYWISAPFLPYPALLATTVVGGILGVPVFSVIRQAVAARVPEAQRRQAFALDSMIVELAFMVGPAVAVLAVTTMHGAGATMAAIGTLTVGSVTALWLLDPPIGRARSAAGAEAAGDVAVVAKVPLSTWLHPSFVLVLAVCLAASLILSGTEVSIVATLRHLGETQWSGLVIMSWCLVSLLGGFWHGSTARPWPLPLLVLLLGAGTVPVGVAGHWGWPWLCLALLPAGFVCAPTIASTVEAVSRAVPASARGQAMGLQGSAMTVGGSLGAPLAGVVIDNSAPVWGFAVTGGIGAVLAAVMLAVSRSGAVGAAGAGARPAAVPEAAV